MSTASLFARRCAAVGTAVALGFGGVALAANPASASELDETPVVSVPADAALIEVTPWAPHYWADLPGVSLPLIDGLDYTVDRQGDVFTVTATAQPGYVIPEGAQTVWVFGDLIEVTPMPPHYWADVPSVGLPVIDGLDYTVDRHGDVFTITATAQPGYVIPEGAQTVWVFGELIEVTPEAPHYWADVPSVGVPVIDGLDYTVDRQGDVFTITATAQPGYVIPEGAQTVWVFGENTSEPEVESVAETETPDAALPLTDGALAQTGASIPLFAIAGGVLALGAGGGLVLLRRRRAAE